MVSQPGLWLPTQEWPCDWVPTNGVGTELQNATLGLVHRAPCTKRPSCLFFTLISGAKCWRPQSLSQPRSLSDCMEHTPSSFSLFPYHTVNGVLHEWEINLFSGKPLRFGILSGRADGITSKNSACMCTVCVHVCLLLTQNSDLYRIKNQMEIEPKEDLIPECGRLSC